MLYTFTEGTTYFVRVEGPEVFEQVRILKRNKHTIAFQVIDPKDPEKRVHTASVYQRHPYYGCTSEYFEVDMLRAGANVQAIDVVPECWLPIEEQSFKHFMVGSIYTTPTPAGGDLTMKVVARENDTLIITFADDPDTRVTRDIVRTDDCECVLAYEYRYPYPHHKDPVKGYFYAG